MTAAKSLQTKASDALAAPIAKAVGTAIAGLLPDFEEMDVTDTEGNTVTVCGSNLLACEE